MPSNVVTPDVRKALEAKGMRFVETDNQGKIKEGENAGKTWSSVYTPKRADSAQCKDAIEDIKDKVLENIFIVQLTAQHLVKDFLSVYSRKKAQHRERHIQPCRSLY